MVRFSKHTDKGL